MNILFDLDGTLADPFWAIKSSLIYALNVNDLPIPEDAIIRKCIGPPLHQSLNKILGIGEKLIPKIMADYRLHHAKDGIDQYTFYPHVQDSLKKLASSGQRLFVATSKPWTFALVILERFQLDPYFVAIYGSELDGRRSDKGELIKYILEKEVLTAQSTWMIGDREYDILGAKKNHISSIGVLWGFGDKKELELAGANYICANFEELNQIFKNF